MQKFSTCFLVKKPKIFAENVVFGNVVFNLATNRRTTVHRCAPFSALTSPAISAKAAEVACHVDILDALGVTLTVGVIIFDKPEAELHKIVEIFYVVLMALQFSVNKFYQSKNGSGIMTSLLYTSLSGLATGAIFFCSNGFRLDVTPLSFVYAVLIAALCLGYSLLGFKIFSLGNFSVFTMFLMLGGMIVPSVFGIMVGEALTWGKVLCALLIMGAMALSVEKTGSGKKGAAKHGERK